MRIDVKTDPHIPGREPVARVVEAEIERALEPFSAWVTRVEVHLRDENGDRAGGGQKRCIIEARPAQGAPITVSHRAPSVRPAVGAAIRELALELERVRPAKRRG
jgi:hypothetical protein